MADKMEWMTKDGQIDFNELTSGEIQLNLTETENSSLNSSKDDDSIEELLEEKKTEFSEVFDTKRKELDKIQQDLNELMNRLNNFIANSQEDLYSGDTDSVDVQNDDDDDISEKQDGPQEKELIKHKYCNGIPIDEMYVTDGLNPPEINWDILAPFIQNVVGDLKKIRNLNQMTNSVLQRIKNITSTSDNIPEEK